MGGSNWLRLASQLYSQLCGTSQTQIGRYFPLQTPTGLHQTLRDCRLQADKTTFQVPVQHESGRTVPAMGWGRIYAKDSKTQVKFEVLFKHVQVGS